MSLCNHLDLALILGIVGMAFSLAALILITVNMLLELKRSRRNA